MTRVPGGTDDPQAETSAPTPSLTPTGTSTAEGVAAAAAGRRVVIGVEDVELPYWAQVDQQVVSASTWRMVSAVPRVVAGVTRRAWRAAPGWTVATAVLELASGAVTAFGLLSTAQVFTSLLAAGPTPQRVLGALPALALVVIAYAVRGVLDSATGMVQSSLAPLVERQAQDELYAALVDVELVAHDDPDFTELVQRASSMGLTRLRIATEGAADLVASLVSVAAAVVTAGLLHPLLAAVVLLTVLPHGWSSVRVAKINYASFIRSSSRQRRLGVTADLITSRADAAEIRAFTTGPMLLAELRRTADSLTDEAVAVARRATSVRLAGRGLSGTGTGAAYAVLGLLLYTGRLPLALAGAAAIALRTAASAVSTSVFSANRIYESSFYIDLLTRCRIDAQARTRAPATASLPAGAPTLIQLDHVGFTYPGQAHAAVDEVCLTLRAGQTVALVGENGSGKSTLAKLLTGLYLPDTGAVRWDGLDVATAAAADLHQRVAVVMQDPTEWPMTAADNVRIGRLEHPDPGDAHLLASAARAGADSVITALPQGWDTMLSRSFQTGRDLSGGQWQRISVARGLYRDAALVVADEPTAAMDARAEHHVFERLHELSRSTSGPDQRHGRAAEKITVLITHRLANVRHADLIAVMHRGRLAEAGSHEQLIAAGGGYAEMFALQSAAYHEDPISGTASGVSRTDDGEAAQ